MLCPACGGGRRRPALEAQADAGVCRWCAAEGLLECSACMRGIHFRGQCGAWLRGASRFFSAGPLEERVLCLDCAWQWVRELHNATLLEGALGRAQPAFDYMSTLALECRPGAGSFRVSAQEAAATPVRRAMRWIVRTLQRARWIDEGRLVRLAEDSLAGRPDGGSTSALRRAVRTAMLELRRTRRVWRLASRTGRAVRLHRGEAVAPALHAAVRSPRRRSRRRSRE